ncbi:MAG: tetratricopeptide repeat-containing glycosyltransferase family protein [Rhodospirillales bacterium]|jgi:tetratricopeptide (TPR) repeat protein|nr:tetratricopeptide repeat-containing glycosyltransferase family protein [Rhodospirillales bacterium]
MSDDALEKTFKAALECHQRGDLTVAEELYEEVLRAVPAHSSSLHNLSLIYQQSGRIDEAVGLLRGVVESAPNGETLGAALESLLPVLGQIAQGLHEQGRTEEGLVYLEKVLVLGLAHPDLLVQLGSMYAALGRTDDAIGAWRQTLAVSPAHRAATHNLALALAKGGHDDEALALYAAAHERYPDDPSFVTGAGLVNARTGLLQGARRHYREAVERQPDQASAWYGLGLIERDLGHIEEARKCQEWVTRLLPDYPDGHFELAHLLLLDGELERGFAEHEWRLRRPNVRNRTFPGPMWDGSDPAGKHVLLYGEQGAGDVIQFIRYAPLLAARGAHLSVACHDSLTKLLSTVDGIERVVPFFDEPRDFDLHAPLMSLPFILQTSLDSIPSLIPYIPVPETPAPDVLKKTGELRVGLAWAGSPEHTNDARRSCRLADLAPLTEIDGVRLFSLQVGTDELAERPGMGIHDLTAGISDYADTAALIAHLDLVIAVDTSVVHLTGAMGRPVWVLLPHVCDWRWLRRRDDSPWYPTARLFRQALPDDWTACIEEVAGALSTQVPSGTGEG